MKKIEIIYILLLSVFLATSCDNDLDQIPPKDLESSALTEYEPVLFAAYYYQTGASTPLLIMGDFRADNMQMIEEPYPAFDRFNADLAGGDLVEQFFRPFYSNLYKAILSANNVIDNSADDTEISEAYFLRALSYFKLVTVFGDVTINLSPTPNTSDLSILERQPADDVYNNIIIPDLQAAISGLTNSEISEGRASQLAAQALLGKVYMYRGNYNSAAPLLAGVVNNAGGVGVTLEPDFANVVVDENSEVIFATKFSSSISDAYSFASEFPIWFSGADTKSPLPLDPDLTAAFDESSANAGATDLRKDLTIDEVNNTGIKYTGALEQDHIEMRLSDFILMHAEALNETTNATGAQSATILALLDDIRSRAGLPSLVGTATTQAEVRTAIAKERRLELALEGHRWFDLVRTNTVDEEMGEVINSNYYIFPIPTSEITATNSVITQNPGY
ncbi:membrane protein [Tamlana sedimentorum]|uniref:Membrane protein n=1 Tax=Neotamlana sedimentorum TaxID=1435349 RepID=A0A0D7WDM2_9FLAO|nr:RagB/SusD family nutrient uptake outer membrane protein [Tamlana sedimentorum]KJD37199.1 membrane protein [Tamlana sedimentorum]